jgi:hypothetical protein
MVLKKLKVRQLDASCQGDGGNVAGVCGSTSSELAKETAHAATGKYHGTVKKRHGSAKRIPHPRTYARAIHDGKIHELVMGHPLHKAAPLL